MSLETVLVALSVALLVSIFVHFMLNWRMGIRLRRLEVSLAEIEERIYKEVKTRAARASVEARRAATGGLNPVDAAILQAHRGGSPDAFVARGGGGVDLSPFHLDEQAKG